MKNFMHDHNRLWDYQVMEELGRGQYGIVYKVKNKKDNRLYALKKTNVATLHQKQKVQAFREIKALKLISHPNIIEYYESFLSVENIYIVMEYAAKGDFAKIVKERRHKEKYYSEQQLWQMFTDLISGLKFLHQHKIVHRDFKIDNIFLTESGRIKIGDLGMSKMLFKDSDLISTRVGTPIYFAPQLIQHQLYTYPVDVWAMGCVFYCLTALEHPFREATIETLSYYVLNRQIKPLKGHYSANLINFIMLILQKNQKERLNIEEIYLKLKDRDNGIINKMSVYNLKKLLNMKQQMEGLNKHLKYISKHKRDYSQKSEKESPSKKMDNRSVCNSEKIKDNPENRLEFIDAQSNFDFELNLSPRRLSRKTSLRKDPECSKKMSQSVIVQKPQSSPSKSPIKTSGFGTTLIRAQFSQKIKNTQPLISPQKMVIPNLMEMQDMSPQLKKGGFRQKFIKRGSTFN